MKKINTNYTDYEFDVDSSEGTVIARTTFAGKEVNAKAKCHPDDKFNSSSGCDLAAARCNKKVAKLRVAMARKKVNAATYEVAMANAKLSKALSYLDDSIKANKLAISKYDKCLNSCK